MAVNYDIIKKSGSWFSYGNERLGQGRDKVKEIIQNDERLAAELEEKIKVKMAQEQETSENKFRGSAIPKAETEPAEPQETVKHTREAARAKLDIAVEDDDE